MSNLLDKASIILTPTAYNNGEALCVKPSDGSGDFDFSRNSAATRVNAQGLVENVQILSSNLVQNGDFSEEGSEEVSNGSFSQEGSELITNGDFSNGLTDWSVVGGSYASVNNGILNSNNTVNGSWFGQYIAQDVSFVNGKTYKVTFIAKNISGGLNLRLTQGANVVANLNLTSEFVSYTYYYTSNADNGSLRMFCNDAVGQFEIDNISVREVGQNWTLGTGWSIGEDKAVFIGSSSGEYLVQNNVYTLNSSIKLTFDVLDYVSGSVRIIGGGTVWASGSVSSNGTHTFYINTSGAVNNNIYVQAISGNFDGSITNISVKEVGQNWTLNDWSVGDSLISSGNTSTLLQQSFIYTSTTSIYKTTFRARSVSGASVSLRLYDGGGTNYETFTITSSNFQDFELTRQRAGADSGLSFYNNSNAEIEITNISVIEITDETNLPRINYEGFSYQDALGSELITNGGFEDGLTDWTAYAGTISIETNIVHSGTQSAKVDGVGIQQSRSYTDGEQVYYNFWVYSTTGTSVFIQTINENVTIPLNQWVQVSGIGTINGNNSSFRIRIANGLWYIDNVSVKEYLGQEVVPDSGCGSWLWEPQSTNLTSYSSDYTNWVGRISLSVDLNQGTSPSGETDANLISVGIDASATRHRLYNLNSFVLGNDYTFSVFAKKSDNNWFQLMFGQTAFGTQCYANFDLDNGVIGNVGTSTDANIVDYGNGWYRCLITCTATATSNTTFEILTTNNTNSGRYPSYQSTANTNVCFLWGAQLEEQTYATSYIPTEGATVTRNQDVCTNGGSLASINSTEGVLYAEIAALANDLTQRQISIDDGTGTNRIILRYNNVSNNINAYLFSGSVQGGELNFIASDITQFNKIAFSYKQNEFKLFVNGTQRAIDTSGNTFSPNTLNDLSFDFNGGFPFFGKTKALAVWKEALSDSELQSLTTI